MTKQEFIDLAIDMVNGGPTQDNRKYHPVVIGKIVDTALNSFIGQSVKEATQLNSGVFDSSWIKTFERIRIKWDGYREICYIDFGSEVLPLEGNKGIREIGWPQSDDSPSFHIMPASSYGIISDLECSDLGTNFIALVEGEKILFPKMPKIYVKQKRSLMLKAVCAASSYSKNEMLPIPEEKTADVMTLITNLMAPMRAAKVKVSNDSNPNTI